MIGVALVGLALAVQAQTRNPDPPVRVEAAVSGKVVSDTGVAATRADVAPTIDGRADDAVWSKTPAATNFRMWRPTEGKEPRAGFKTEARIAYDASNLYVFVRAYDPHPDSIITLLERRDTYTSSDMIWVFVDSYRDRRTGYEFGVNAAGVKMDMAIYDDGNEDPAWDAVWDVATQVDSLGWTAEYRIPLSQMRYSSDKSHIFGFLIDRNIYRYSERVSWPLLRQSKPGFVSQFGALEGMDDLETPRRMEAVPYVVTKQATEVIDNRFQNKSRVSMGGDVKYRIAPSVTLDATINPDFGQVESDPAVLNLTAYESFFDERRPFFVAGQGLFKYSINCSAVNCNGENLFYSRRIGRTPTTADDDPRRRKAHRPIPDRAHGRDDGRGDEARQQPGRHDVRADDELHRHPRHAGHAQGEQRHRRHADRGEPPHGSVVVAVHDVRCLRGCPRLPAQVPEEHLRSDRRAGLQPRTRRPARHARSPAKCGALLSASGCEPSAGLEPHAALR
ncbi:MAG: hypothetical protein DMD35_00165 [Gemmatimonadetes bacterium]|nr:MAG: hypothetical protein DMD35_00165 [Gemmatimonadota bacterium]